MAPPVTVLEPGTINQLRTGQSIKFAQPTTATQVEPMMMYPLMAMSAAVGCTYDQVTGDLRGANYSSLRAGKIEFRVLVEQTQQLILIPRFCQRVWDRFIDRAILAGELNERTNNYPCDWVTPAWESVNPKFDQDAEERSVRSGRMTPQEFIASWGADWRKVQDDFAEFYKRADSLGLVFDVDPRLVNRAGGLQPTPKAPGAEGGPASNGHDPGSELDADALKDKLAENDPDGGEGRSTHSPFWLQ